MAHFWDHAATQDGVQLTLLGFCQCGAVKSMTPGDSEGRNWEEMVPGVSQCEEYERRMLVLTKGIK